MFSGLVNSVKNTLNNAAMGVSDKLGLNPPPTTDHFRINGQLSPSEFIRAGDKLVQSCGGWTWSKSQSSSYKSKYLEEDKQFLVLKNVKCEQRVSSLTPKSNNLVEKEDEDGVIVIAPREGVEETKEDPNAGFRFYTMYIVYDEYYYTPRMYFSATTKEGQLVSSFRKNLTYEEIKLDVMEEYRDATLTNESFKFVDGATMPTVHPCKHANVLKEMSDTIEEGGTPVKPEVALFIFLKFIATVIPTVQFDLTGDLWLS